MSSTQNTQRQSLNLSSLQLRTTQQAQQASSRVKKWTKNPTNDADKGKVYERLAVVSTFLTLQDGQELICEMKEAGKFDDVVVWVENDGWYLRQIKHKQDGSFKIKHADLFPSRSHMFDLNNYVSSFLNQIDRYPLIARNVHELTLTTNVDFDASCMQFLEKADPSQVWMPLSDRDNRERFKFKSSENQNIITKLSKNNPQRTTDIELFLEKLVFEVKCPGIIDQSFFIKEKLRSLIPLELNDSQVEEASRMFQQKVKDFFDKLTSENESWADVQLRTEFLLSIVNTLRNSVKLGSTLNYQASCLIPILNKIHSIDFLPQLKPTFETFLRSKSSLFTALNIIVSPETSYPVLASCKVLHYARNNVSVDFDYNQLWIINVESEDDGVGFAKIFEHTNVGLFSNFTFVVEFSQELCTTGATARIVPKILSKLQIEHPMKFIFITSLIINPPPSMGSFQTLSDALSYGSISDEGRQILSRKRLLLRNGSFVTLNGLGINLENLDELSLSELVLANDKSQLDLCLPMYDEDIKETYVRRELTLPVVDMTKLSKDMRSQCYFDWCEYDAAMEKSPSGPIYLLRSLSALNIPTTVNENFFLVLKSDNVAGEEDRKYLENASVTISENILIHDDTILFEKSRNAKAALIVVDLPGMGKSSLLTNLCNTMLEKIRHAEEDPMMRKLVIRINLGRCPPKTWGTRLENENDVSDFFSSHQFQSNAKKSQQCDMLKRTLISLSRCIFREILNGRSSWSATAMLDGFDEISKVGRDFVTGKLIHRWLNSMKGVKKIIVTSRPDGGVHKELEGLFHRLPLRLVSLGWDNQKDLLGALWRKRLREENQFSAMDDSYVSKRTADFASHLVYKARCQLQYEDIFKQSVIDIPLQCILFADCFYDELKRHIECPSLLPANEYNFDALTLFETFINKKFDILYYTKEMNEIKSDCAKEHYDTRKKSCIDKGMRIAVYYMIRNKEITQHLLGKECGQLENWFKHDFTDLKKVGLLTYFADDVCETANFEFIHRTFAEYFVAKCFVHIFADCNITPCREVHEIILDIIVCRHEYAGVRRFLTRMIKPLLPDFGEGCPFGMRERTSVVSNFPILSHGTFNDYLADCIISGRISNVFVHFLDESGKVHRLDYKLGLFMPLFKWLLLCLKEHVVRGLTRTYTNQLITIVCEDSLKFFSNVPKLTKKSLQSNALAAIQYEKELLFALLTWYIHFIEAEETRATLKSCLLRLVEHFVGLHGDPLDNIHFLATISSAVTRQRGYGLEVNKLVQRIFNDDREVYCEGSWLVHSYDFMEDSSSASRDLKLWHLARIWFENENEKCSLRLHHIDRINVCFKEILEMGSPKAHGGETSFLEIQIRWFLSLGPPSLEKNYKWFSRSGLSYQRYMRETCLLRKTRWMNPFLVMCVDYLLLMIECHFTDGFKADDFRKQIVRQALRLDVRILSWLKRVRIFRKRYGNSEDFEEIAVKKAINFLPKAHLAAHYGDFTQQLLQDDPSLCLQLFDWSPEKESFRVVTSSLNASGERSETEPARQAKEEYIFESFLRDAHSGDQIPPALYLAAANHQVNFCYEAMIGLKGKKDKITPFLAQCMKFALHCCDDESLVVPFLDAAMINYTRDELCEIFISLLFTNNYAEKLKNSEQCFGDTPAESLLIYILAERRWTRFLVKFLDFYIDEVGERTNRILKIITSSFKQDSPSYARDLLVHALTLADEAGIVHDAFYSPTGHSIVKSLIKYFAHMRIESVIRNNHEQIVKRETIMSRHYFKELRNSLRKILSTIWDMAGEEKFVKFVCGSEKYAFGIDCEYMIDSATELDNALLSDIVQEFIPEKLTDLGNSVMFGMITDERRCWLHLLAHMKTIMIKSRDFSPEI